MTVSRSVRYEPGTGFAAWGNQGLMLPQRFSVTFDESGRPVLVELEVEVIAGQPRCRRITCTARSDDDFVHSEVLKGLPITHYLRIGAADAALRASPAEGGGTVLEPVAGNDVELVTDALQRVGRRRQLLTPDFLREVADVYRDNLRTAPTQAVAEHYFTSRQNAGKWVKRAREAGLLEEGI